MSRAFLRLSILCATTLYTLPAHATAFQVGPTRSYTTPSQVAPLVLDGDEVDIDPDTYTGDVAIWNANRLHLRGAGGLAHLDAAGAAADGKAIWVITGSDVVVEDIEFSGATVRDRNGAGIRQEGRNLTIRGCYFHDNENGILVSEDTMSDVVIERSVFDHNGFGDGYSHGMYINRVHSFTLRYSWVHDTRVGHDVKSRAEINYILYNRLTDEDGGDASYELQLANGGLAYVVGNVIQQGENTQNSTILSFADEGTFAGVPQGLYVVNNTFVNDRSSGTFVRNATTAPARVVNNIFAGSGTVLDGPGTPESNWTGRDPRFVDRASFDYHLTEGSPAVNAGVAPGMAGSFALAPDSEYVHPASRGDRRSDSVLDLGAFELVPGTTFDGGQGPADAAPVEVDAGEADAGVAAQDAAPAEDAAAPDAEASDAAGPVPPDAEVIDTGSTTSDVDAGVVADAGVAAAKGDSGCTCVAPSARSPLSSIVALAALAFAFTRRRR